MTKEEILNKQTPVNIEGKNYITWEQAMDAMNELETELRKQPVSGSLPMPSKNGLIREAENRYVKETRIRKYCKEIGFIEGA